MNGKFKDPASAKQATVLFLENDERLRYNLRYFLWREGHETFSIGTLEDFAPQTLVGGQKRALLVAYLYLDPITKEMEGYTFIQRWETADPDLSYVKISENHQIWDLYDVNSRDVRHLVQLTNLNDLFSAVRSVLNE